MKAKTPKIKGFHAHVYYDPETRDAAQRVREGLSRFAVRLGSWHDEPVGPHPKSMYQVVFSPDQFGEVVPWLMLHREGLDVLVHPETGDAGGDHLERSLWLGKKLEIFKRA
ncbi:MAG: DOPA 4,5-dioxygenase family protein [Deltaproteobacteria bacterium]|nr:DOPA 4,5-dioxygenase family protein [Deltaproteobacteria bacterium]